MNNIRTILASYEQACEVMEQHKALLEEVLHKLIEILTEEKNHHYSIEEIRQRDDGLSIHISGSCRGCGWDDTVFIPWGIVDASIPLEAAKTHIENMIVEKKQKEVEHKQTLLKRLQEELNIS